MWWLCWDAPVQVKFKSPIWGNQDEGPADFLTIAISSHFLLRCFLNWLREMLPEEKSKNQKTRHSQPIGCSSKEIGPPDFTDGERGRVLLKFIQPVKLESPSTYHSNLSLLLMWGAGERGQFGGFDGCGVPEEYPRSSSEGSCPFTAPEPRPLAVLSRRQPWEGPGGQ